MISVRFQGKPFNITVIQVYAPTSTAEEPEVERYYEDLQDFPGGSDGKVSAYNVGDPGSIPGSGRSPREGNGNSLQYSCLGSPWTEEPGGVAKSRMQLSD